MLSFFTCPSSALSYFFLPSSFFLSVLVCLLTQAWSLIIVISSVSKQDTLLCCFLSDKDGFYVNAGSGLTASKPVHMQGFCFENRENRSYHTGLKVHKEMSGWGGEEKERGEGWAGKYQALSWESRLTNSCSRGQHSRMLPSVLKLSSRMD